MVELWAPNNLCPHAITIYKQLIGGDKISGSTGDCSAIVFTPSFDFIILSHQIELSAGVQDGWASELIKYHQRDNTKTLESHPKN